jgi:1,4-dihydroxy-2-naphthoate octaprenyltransferase
MTQTGAQGLSLWIVKVRAPFFTAVVVPTLLGTAIAWARGGEFHLGYFLLTLIGVICLHAGANMSNDYFDHKNGTDYINEEFVSPFTGGSRLIQTGAVQPRQVLLEALAYYAVGTLIGLYLGWARGPWVLVIGLIGGLSGYFYTAPPFFLVATGLGEVFIGLNFGLLVTLGSYYVQTGQLAWEPAIAALPVAFLIAAVLYINEFQDMVADKAVGKNHLVVRLGRQKAVVGYGLIMAAVYVSIILGVLAAGVTPFALLGLLTVPLAWRAWQVARVKYDSPRELAPANAGTIQAHLYTGLLLTLGYVIQALVQSLM